MALANSTIVQPVRSLRGLNGMQPGPDTGAGMATPCTMSDWFAPSANCLAFLQVFDPTNAVYGAASGAYAVGQASIDAAVGTQLGPLALTIADPTLGSSIIASTTGVISDTVSSAASALSNQLPNAMTAFCTGFESGTGISCTELLLAAAAIAAFMIYKK
jgi:hypothetical protein